MLNYTVFIFLKKENQLFYLLKCSICHLVANLSLNNLCLTCVLHVLSVYRSGLSSALGRIVFKYAYCHNVNKDIPGN